MAHNAEAVQILSESECWRRLDTQSVGRLVTRVGDVVDIAPVNFVVDGPTVVFRTAEGTKLAELTINGDVLFEADEYGAHEAWSVVVRGRAARIESQEEQLEAERLPLRPMLPTVKQNFVRVTADSISGRAFEVGEEPDREAAGQTG